MTESDMWKRIKSKVRYGHWTRIENAVTSGVPDVYVCVGPKDFWIELKVLHRLIKFRPAELAWMSNRMREDRDTVILAADDNQWKIYYFIECLDKGAFIMHLNLPHLDTTKVAPVMETSSVKEVLDFICLKLR